MKQYQQILEKITSSIISNNYVALSDSLDQAYNTCPRSGKYKSAICFGYQHLAKHLSNPAEAIKAFDRSRQMFPGDKELLEDEIDFLGQFIESHKHELCDEDYKLIDAMVKLIHARIPNSFKKRIKQSWSIFLGEIESYKQNSAGGGKSKLYRIAEPMLFNLFSDFTDEEREELRSEIVDQTIHEMMMADYLKKKEADKNKANSSKPS